MPMRVGAGIGLCVGAGVGAGKPDGDRQPIWRPRKALTGV